jgi:hypothetical protein
MRYNLPLAPTTLQLLWQDTTMPIANEQWVLEVQTWIRKGIVNAILHTRKGARMYLKTGPGSMSGDPEALNTGLKDDNGEPSLCDRILFRNPDYTNINWVCFWITTIALILICIASYLIERIDKITRKARNLLLRMLSLFWKQLIRAGKMLWALRKKSRQQNSLGMGWLSALGNLCSPTQPLASTTSAISSGSELRNVGRTSTINTQDRRNELNRLGDMDDIV